MKIGLPSGWYARLLLGGWALFFIGTLLFSLFASFSPGRFAAHFVTPLWALGTFVALATSAYVSAYAVRRLFFYLGGTWRKGGGQGQVQLGPAERILVAGWLVFIAVALASVFLWHQKWVLAYGPEILLSLVCVVGLSSMGYASLLLLRQVMKLIRRG
jgi:hypothetical protein